MYLYTFLKGVKTVKLRTAHYLHQCAFFGCEVSLVNFHLIVHLTILTKLKYLHLLRYGIRLFC